MPPEQFANLVFGHVSPIHRIALKSECDFYGASHLIASAVQESGKLAPKAGLIADNVQGFWTHGWMYYPCPFVEIYRWHDAPEEWPTLVHREGDRATLMAAGLKNVHAVGAPFLYCPKVHVDRLPRSLLVMPFHSLDYVQPRYKEERYFEALDAVIDEFDVVAACVHPSCVRTGRWIEGFEKRGIPYTTGAEATDRNGLLRIKQIMNRFTHVTSNWMGSHIAYASCCGCCVSVYGPRPIFYKEDFGNDPFYKRFPNILDWWIEHENSSYALRTYAFLFVRPDKATPHEAWGLSQLGAECGRSSENIYELLRAPTPSRRSLGRPLTAVIRKATEVLRGKKTK